MDTTVLIIDSLFGFHEYNKYFLDHFDIIYFQEQLRKTEQNIVDLEKQYELLSVSNVTLGSVLCRVLLETFCFVCAKKCDDLTHLFPMYTLSTP